MGEREREKKDEDEDKEVAEEEKKLLVADSLCTIIANKT